jgi:hypothetical protein
VNTGGRNPRAENLVPFPSIMSKQALRHLAPARVMGAEKDDPLPSDLHLPRPAFAPFFL